jgi:hypothetical protein
MGVSDKVTLSGPGAYIASLERDLASMRASRDALAVALKDASELLAADFPDSAQIRIDAALAEHAKGEAS